MRVALQMLPEYTPRRTSKPRPNGRGVPMRTVWIKRRAALSYATLDVSAKRGAAAIGVDRRNWERRIDGEHHSPLSRVTEEAVKLEESGVSSAFMYVHLKVTAMLPKYLHLTTEQLLEEKRKTHTKEQLANGVLDRLQMDDLQGIGDVIALRKAAMAQAEATEELVAILDALAAKEGK